MFSPHQHQIPTKYQSVCLIFSLFFKTWAVLSMLINFNLSFQLETRAHSVYSKKGSSLSDLSLYFPPIALTSILSKMLESILRRRNWEHLKSNNFIWNRQYNFRGNLHSYFSHSWSSGGSLAVALDINFRYSLAQNIHF